MPPEAISQNSSYSFEFDWWGFGVLMYKMLTGVFPFESREPAELLYMIKYKDIDIMNDINLVNLSYDTKDLLKKLLTNALCMYISLILYYLFSYVSRISKPTITDYKFTVNIKFLYLLYISNNNITAVPL